MGDLCRYVDIMVWLEGCRQCAACHCEGVSNAFDNVREVKSAGEFGIGTRCPAGVTFRADVVIAVGSWCCLEPLKSLLSL